MAVDSSQKGCSPGYSKTGPEEEMEFTKNFWFKESTFDW